MSTDHEIAANLAYREWSALDGNLEFRFVIDRNLADGAPTLATVWSLCARMPSGAATERQFQIVSTNWTQVDLHFESGVEVSGRFIQKNNVLINSENCIAIFVDVEFGASFDEMQHFEGVMVYCACARPNPPAPPYPPSPPSPPSPPLPPLPPAPPIGPGDDDPGEPVSPKANILTPYERLFPYIYMRQWSALDLAEFASAFIQFTETSPPDPFISELANVETAAEREELAMAFVTGAPPYEGLFIAFPRNLDSPVACFPGISDRLHQLGTNPQAWLACAEGALAEALLISDEPADYYCSQEYLALIERTWQTYFALCILNEYAQQLRDEMARILFVAHIAAVALQERDGILVLHDLSDKTIQELRSAMIALPEFVLERSAKTITEGGSWALPYAIGDLQLVRQQLKGYAPGEIARIESVLPGERREVQNRRLRQSFESDQFESLEAQSSQLESDDARDSLQREAQRALGEKTITKGYDNYQTSYGPPTSATLNGKAITTFDYGDPARNDDVSRFARKILSNSVARLSRSVRASRATAALFESEQLVSSIVDNTQGRSAIQAVYRWVNKVFEAQVVNYGRRVMVEFSIAQPARDYIDVQAELSGSALRRPASPREAYDVRSFEDITRSNYAAICGTYNVTDLNPPPPEFLIIGTTLRGDDEQLVSVPSGYQTVEAKAECTSNPAGQSPPPVLVGSVQLAGSVAAQLPAYGGGYAVPVSSASPVPTITPLPTGSPPEVPVVSTYLTNVEIRCAPTTERMNEWKISVYRAVIQAYRASAEEYFEALDQPGSDKGSSVNPQYELDTERSELKARCIDLMIDCQIDPQGQDDQASPPANIPVYRSLYQQFLNAALEWREMTYTFGLDGGSYADFDPVRDAAQAQQGSPFARFLQAAEARVLVPLCPLHLRAFLYFWSTGLIWQGPDWLVPVHKDNIALVIDAEWGPGTGQEIEVARWPLLIPTAMQVLDDGTSSFSASPMLETQETFDV